MPMLGNMARLAIVFEGGLILLALSLGWLLGSPPFERVSLTWQAVVWGGVATGPPFLGVWWCTRLRWGPFSRLMREVEERLIPLFASCSCFELALISVFGGVGEEALFRGVIQETLTGWLNPWAALVVASGLFGLGHLITPTYAVLAGLIGLYLGGLSMAYDNLLVVVVVHALYDFVALVYLIGRHRAKQKAGLSPD